MLKIKDNVELKKLKGYGFTYNDEIGQYKFCERNVDGATCLYINVWNRKVLFRQDKISDNLCLAKLYDLIQAGLVEKVSD